MIISKLVTLVSTRDSTVPGIYIFLADGSNCKPPCTSLEYSLQMLRVVCTALKILKLPTFNYFSVHGRMHS